MPPAAIRCRSRQKKLKKEKKKMWFRKSAASLRREKQPQKIISGNKSQTMTPEEMRHHIAMEMSWGYGMLPPGGFPDGIWHLY